MAKFYPSWRTPKTSGVNSPIITETHVDPAIFYSWPMTSLKILSDTDTDCNTLYGEIIYYTGNNFCPYLDMMYNVGLM